MKKKEITDVVDAFLSSVKERGDISYVECEASYYVTGSPRSCILRKPQRRKHFLLKMHVEYVFNLFSPPTPLRSLSAAHMHEYFNITGKIVFPFYKLLKHASKFLLYGSLAVHNISNIYNVYSCLAAETIE